MNDSPPSGFRIEQAMSTWQSTRARLVADDADLARDEGALIELLGDAEGDVRDILARLLQATQHATAMAAAADDMVTTLKGRIDRYKRRVETFRGTMFAIMDALGERKIELPHGTLSISAGKPAAIITDETEIPDRFVTVTTTRKIDKVALLTALKDGEVIDGATLSNSLPTLTLRSK